jgi:hypothetical protein
MIDISKLYVDLDIVLNKRTTLDCLFTPQELDQFKKKAEKNHWDDNTIVANLYRELKENIHDYLSNSDFLDANVIVESDPYVIKAMELMSASQRHAEVLLVDKSYKYPGCWVESIAKALRNLQCKEEDYICLVWDAYYMRNFNMNKDIPGWTHLANILEDYYDTL